MSEFDPLPREYFDPPNLIIVGADERRITPQEWTVLQQLWQSRGALVSGRGFLEVLYPEPKTPPKQVANLLKVTICRLRAKLAGTPVKIETVHRKGYRLRRTATAAA